MRVIVRPRHRCTWQQQLAIVVVRWLDRCRGRALPGRHRYSEGRG